MRISSVFDLAAVWKAGLQFLAAAIFLLYYNVHTLYVTHPCLRKIMLNGLYYVITSLENSLPAHAGSSLADFSTLKMEAIWSSETSVQSTTSTRRHTSEDGILHSHRRENLKSYIVYNLV
jgi:hypothetical protein